MEALVSGALVMTDPMLIMPKGLRDGESVVVYHSLDELESKVEYYLQRPEERVRIARKGYQVAMTTHRSWHVTERIVQRTLGVSFG